MVIRAVLAGSLLALVPTMNDCGGEQQWGQPPPNRPAQCAPKVHFPRPVRGTVVDTKECTFFGVPTTYVKIDVYKSRAVVWAVAPPGGCTGSEWDLSYGSATPC